MDLQCSFLVIIIFTLTSAKSAPFSLLISYYMLNHNNVDCMKYFLDFHVGYNTGRFVFKNMQNLNLLNQKLHAILKLIWILLSDTVSTKAKCIQGDNGEKQSLYGVVHMFPALSGMQNQWPLKKCTNVKKLNQNVVPHQYECSAPIFTQPPPLMLEINFSQLL